MFHLYFGAFDIVLYAVGAGLAVVWANALFNGATASESTKALPSSNMVHPTAGLLMPETESAHDAQDQQLRASNN